MAPRRDSRPGGGFFVVRRGRSAHDVCPGVRPPGCMTTKPEGPMPAFIPARKVAVFWAGHSLNSALTLICRGGAEC
jgi:hypothetical protein